MMKLSRITNCNHCLFSLNGTTRENSLQNCKDYGNFLYHPSKLVKLVLEKCEAILTKSFQYENVFEHYFFDKVCMRCMNCIISTSISIFKEFDEHGYDLVKQIVTIFCTIRFKHFAKLKNE